VARTAQIGSDGSGSLGDLVVTPVAGAVELPPAGPWTIDPVHSSAVATARHLGIASIKARFSDISGRIEIGRPAEQSRVEAEIKAESIDTGIKMRDDHLRSPDFLDVERFPTVEYQGTGLTATGPDRCWVTAPTPSWPSWRIPDERAADRAGRARPAGHLQPAGGAQRAESADVPTVA